MTSPQSQSSHRANEPSESHQPAGVVACGSKNCHWHGKTAVICGGSQGLGLSIAEELMQQNIAHLILIARNREQLTRAAEHLHSLRKNKVSKTQAAKNRTASMQADLSENALDRNVDIRITPMAADLTDAKSAQAAAIEISLVAPEVDLVIQAIGTSDRGTIAGLTRERLHELIDTNLVTSLHAIQQLSPLFPARGGVIVLVGSLSSLFAPRFLGGYSIAKHGLVALAQQARLELAEKGIHVMLCCPGPIARPDSGSRYANETRKLDLPPEAELPGGGAKVKGLCPQRLAKHILRAAERRELLMIRPKKAWWLRLLSAALPGLGERILRRKSS